MTTFVRGRPVSQANPRVTVDAGLPVGRHRFQLEVLSDDGRRSAPDVVDIVVEAGSLSPTNPTDLVSPTRPRDPLGPVTGPILTPTPIVRPLMQDPAVRASPSDAAVSPDTPLSISTTPALPPQAPAPLLPISSIAAAVASALTALTPPTGSPL